MQKNTQETIFFICYVCILSGDSKDRPAWMVGGLQTSSMLGPSRKLNKKRVLIL